MFFGTLFLYFYLTYLKRYQYYRDIKSLTVIVVITLLANIAIYYKEPVFLSVGVFAFIHLTLSWRRTNFRSKLLDTLLLVSSFIFVLIYYFIIYLNSSSINYAEGLAPKSFIGIIRNVLIYIFSDPVLLFCFLPFTAWRAYRVLIKRRTLHPVYDAMLGAGLVYIAAIFKLSLQSSYYLLPAYIFAVPALVFFITRIQKRLMAKRWWQIAIVMAIFFQVTSAVPLGLETLSEYKYIPINANLTMDFLVKEIKSKQPHQRVNLFLDGINRNSNGYQYNDFGQYLKYKGLTIQDFDLKSDLPPDNQYPWEPVTHSPYSVFQSAKAAQIFSSDYLIITPYSYQQITDVYLNSMELDYKLLFRTYSRWAIPNIGLERVIKYFLIKVLPENNTKDMIRQGGKIFEPIVDYYVFMRK